MTSRTSRARARGLLRHATRMSLQWLRRLTIFAIEQEKFFLMEARKCLKSPETLDDVVKGLHVLFEDDHVNVEEVISFLSSYRSNPADWAKYANYDPHRWDDDIMLTICVFIKT